MMILPSQFFVVPLEIAFNLQMLQAEVDTGGNKCRGDSQTNKLYPKTIKRISNAGDIVFKKERHLLFSAEQIASKQNPADISYD
jgi:hypothetical protein